MIGIISYGIGIPYYRIKRETIRKAMGWFNAASGGLKGEKAVANHDEDSLTLAVAAGTDCITEGARDRIDTLYLASTTLPYTERSGAAMAGAALNLPAGTRAAELSGGLKSATTALISALNEAGEGAKLVCASDCRLGKAGGTMEALLGDGAAALMVGTGDLIASFEAHHSVSYDFADTRRIDGDRFVRTWEERWIREEGYFRFIPEAVNGLLDKCGLKMSDVNKVIFPPLGPRDHAALAKRMELNQEQVQAHLLEEVGHTGAAHPLLMLIAALEEASPGDRMIVASFGSGSDALMFRMAEAAADSASRNRLRTNLDYKQEMESYSKYLSFKDMLDKEIGIRGEEVAPTSLSLSWREQDAVLRLVGGKCRACATPQFPKETICVNPDCGAVDQMDPYPFSDKTGRLFTYTADHLTFSEDPPALYGIVDFEGGGRYWFDLTDCRLESLAVDQPVRMTFRRKYQDKSRGLYGYFWKAAPFKG
jgi:3-hydroxy-3-methylglutaryl CoA synthase